MEEQEQSAYVINEDLAMLWRLTRWAFIVPLRFEKLRNGGYRVTTSQGIYIVGIIIIIIFQISFVGFFISNIKDELHNILLFIIHLCHCSVNLTILSSGVICGKSRIKRLIQISKDIQVINQMVTNINLLRKKERKIWTIIIYSLIAYYIGPIIFFFILNSKNDFKNVSLYIIVFVAYVVVVFIEIQQVFFVWSISASARILNERLEHLSVDDVNGNQTQTLSTLERDPKELRNLRNAYLLICSTINNLNDSEGNLMFCIICCQILNIMERIYYLSVACAVTTNTHTQTPNILCEILWFIFYYTALIILIEPIHRLIEETNRTKVLIGALMCKQSLVSNGKVHRQIHNFFQHFISNPPSFTPLGICPCDRTLLATITGGLTSFLVIIMQFKL